MAPSFWDFFIKKWGVLIKQDVLISGGSTLIHHAVNISVHIYHHSFEIRISCHVSHPSFYLIRDSSFWDHNDHLLHPSFQRPSLSSHRPCWQLLGSSRPATGQGLTLAYPPTTPWLAVSRSQLWLPTGTYIYMYVCMYVRMYVCMYICTYVCDYVWTMYVCMYVCMHVST